MNNEKILMDLRKERMELTSKINNLVKFRGTDNCNKLTSTHKQLLDIQLEAMKTYSEALTGRCIELQERTVYEKKNEKSDKQENEEPMTKVIIIDLNNIKD